MNNTNTDYEQKVDAHLRLACEAEENNDKEKAEKEFKFAAFYEARRLGIDTKQYIADCCPVY